MRGCRADALGSGVIRLDEANRIPRSFAVSALLCGLTGGAALFALMRSEIVFQPSLHLLLLLVAAMVSENYALSLPSFNVSLAFPLIIAAIVTDGALGGGLVAAVCFTNVNELRSGRPWPPLLFNFGQLVLAAVCGGLVYESTGAPTLVSQRWVDPLSAGELPVVIFASLAAAVVVYSVNVGLTAYAVSALRGGSRVAIVRNMLRYLPTQMSLAFVGILIAQVMAVQVLALPLFLFPLLLARQVYQRYEHMRDVYLDTVRSLVKALEAKDPYTRGHSERVAEYALQIARALDMDELSVERMERAALLHDIGKLSLPAELLTKPTHLDLSEHESMRRHPVIGAEMIARIPPLKPIAPYVGMHHERIDGTGYPKGLRGSQIPVIARILAVADAYDAMTTARAYRAAMSHSEATQELVAASGTQFDQDIVSCFLDSNATVEAVREYADFSCCGSTSAVES